MGHPSAAPDVRLGGGDPAEHGDDEPDGVVRRVDGEGRAGVGDGDPAAAAGVEVHVVHPDGGGRHELQRREPVQELRGDRLEPRHEQDPGLGRRGRVGFRGQDEAVPALERRGEFREERLCQEHQRAVAGVRGRRLRHTSGRTGRGWRTQFESE